MVSDVLSTRLPERIRRLDELANNLWWSWHPQARDLFRALSYPLWRISGHNPVKQLRDMSQHDLEAAAADPAFLSLYDAVMSAFDNDMSASNRWFPASHPDRPHGLIAYFSMEFAIHNCLPIYAGGLGILAGDTCKEASDMGLPLVGVGFMYPQGYFHQRVSTSGWQEEVYRHIDFDETPISRAYSPGDRRCLVQVQLGSRTVCIGAWRVRAGRTSIYLLDTNLEENAPQDRQLSARLYTADQEQRLQQEIILGVSGVRLLRALGMQPAIWHANEGHAAFMMLERVREEVAKGTSLTEAVRGVQSTSVFTTHTPVPAGHDVFPTRLVEKYVSGHWDSIGVDRQKFLALGQQARLGEHYFDMTALALKMADKRNAVSRLHGQVTRKMWHVLWPEVRVDQVPISHVTNGIHVPTWIAPELGRLYETYLGRDWLKEVDKPELWERITDIPDEELWAVRQFLKRKLMRAILEKAQRGWAIGGLTAQQVLAMGALLEPDVLTLGFVRRFAEYKRPALIFRDVERLKRIVNNRWRPVQVLFAGKSHPADFPSKRLLQHVYMLATDREFQGRIAFVDDYDMHMARYLVHGVDVWLNTPRRLQEACGTSGIKAALNGVPHLSILDGWWHEGYTGINGWAIGNRAEMASPEDEDRADAEALYNLLENEVAPLYYERDRSGVPRAWTRLVKDTIRSVAPVFCARRMMKEYTELMYAAPGPGAQA